MTRAQTSPLSQDPIERTRQLVKRSAPNPYRPRLSDEEEIALAEIDRNAAACYAAIEDSTDRLDVAALRLSRITEEFSADDLSTDGVPLLIDEDISSVHTT